MKWNKEKKKILLNEYPTTNVELLANKLGCTAKAVSRKAETLGIRKIYKQKKQRIYNVNDNYFKNGRQIWLI